MIKISKKIRNLATAIAALTLSAAMIVGVAGCAGTTGEAGPAGPMGPQGEQGPAGPQGPAGESAYVGENGNWWVGDYDTGIFAGNAATPPEEVVELVESLVQTNPEVTGDLNAKGKFYSDYDSLEEARQASREVAIQMAEEGMILLKNENNALPLGRHEKNITMLGIRSAAVMTGGGGAGSGLIDAYGVPSTSLKEGVEMGGFRVNPAMNSYYTSLLPDGVANEYLDEHIAGVRERVNTFEKYNDAAIITISRSGQEGGDLATHDVEGHSDKTDHYLELTDDEEELIRIAKANFDKVIVFINSGNIMELGELNAPKTDDNLGVDAILWIGLVSNDGACAVGPILNGEVNPSGHTTDTWTSDFLSMPSLQNFGDMSHITDADGKAYNNSMYLAGNTSTAYNDFHSVEYREDIYLGYKYYETKWADMEEDEAGSGDEWYADQVVYPFGYGLSYTDFEWELYGSTAKTGTISAANQTVTMQIKVTNVGDYPGKDVVQMYVTPPFEEYGIEKASVNLMGFAKTDLLQPGESQVVTVQCVAQDFASFDWYDMNANGFQGYELEAGDYVISAKSNAHDEGISVVRTINSDILCRTDYTTGNEITAVFSQEDGIWAEFNSVNTSLMDSLMSRTSGLDNPLPASVADRTISQVQADIIEERKTVYSSEDEETDYWYVSDVPDTWEQSDAETEWEVSTTPGFWFLNTPLYIAKRVDSDESKNKAEIQLKDMAGVPFEEYKVVDGEIVVGTDEGSQKWEEFLNQLTWEEMYQLVNHGGYARWNVDSIGMPAQNDNDGPTQLGFSAATSDGVNTVMGLTGMTTNFPPASLMAATWNTEISYEFGRAIGDEALYINVQGWYGPSMNIHRTPFGGRNFEYLSEDGVLSGKMIAPATRGAVEKGLVTYIKHMAVNEQETNRGGIFTWVTEQAMREIYLKPFEIAMKEGHSNGAMTSMNRIGNVRVFANGALNDGIVHNEWNFKGINVTDAAAASTESYADLNALMRNGCDLPLNVWAFQDGSLEVHRFDTEENMVYVSPEGISGSRANFDSTPDSELTLASPTLYYNVRRAARHILYATANSNGMRNGFVGDFEQELTLNAAASGKILSEYSLSDVEVEGNLPEGITIDAEGRISGTPTSEGTYTVTIKCVVDGRMGVVNHIYRQFWQNGELVTIDRTLGEKVSVTLTIVVK